MSNITIDDILRLAAEAEGKHTEEKSFKEELKTYAINLAVKTQHGEVQPSHLLQAVMALSKTREPQVLNIIVSALADNAINGTKLKEGIDKAFPSSGSLRTAAEGVPYHHRTKELMDKLDELEINEDRQCTPADLVMVLFEDTEYSFLDGIFKALGLSEEDIKKLEHKIYSKVKPLRETSNKGINRITRFERNPYVKNLNKEVQDEDIVSVLGNNTQHKIEVVLSTKISKTAVLVGPAGTGKTHAVKEFTQKINKGEVSDRFKEHAVYQLDTVAMLEDRMSVSPNLKSLLQEFTEEPNAILFIDEFHAFAKAITADASILDTMKEFMTTGKLQLLLATTNEEFARDIAKDKAAERRMHKISINEPTDEEMMLILEGTIRTFNDYFDREVEPEFIGNILNLSKKFSLNLANPAKAIGLLDVAYASSVVANNGSVVLNDDVHEALRIKYGIRNIENKTVITAERMFKEILGQEQPLSEITRSLMAVERGLVDTERPLYTAILAGPSGVGKTESAKIIAEEFFGSKDNLIKLSMGEFSDRISVNKIIGSAPGYVGYDDETGLLAQIKQKPGSVVLFDEIEKAHPAVFDILLNMLDEGSMEDQKGNRVSFRQAIILFTTNLGYSADDLNKGTMGIVKETKVVNTAERTVQTLERHFRPEFLNRIEQVVVYNRLTNDIIEQLIQLYHKDFIKVSEKEGGSEGVSKKINKAGIKEIIEKSEISKYGARGVRRAVKDYLLKREMNSAFTDSVLEELLAKNGSN